MLRGHVLRIEYKISHYLIFIRLMLFIARARDLALSHFVLAAKANIQSNKTYWFVVVLIFGFVLKYPAKFFPQLHFHVIEPISNSKKKQDKHKLDPNMIHFY